LTAMSGGKMCLDMKIICSAFLIFIFQIILIPESKAQISPDSVLYAESVSKIHQVYLNEIGDNAEIYHGSEYILNGQKSTGFPFYQADSMLTGSVSYQGNIYSNLKLFYNLVSDELIINNFQHTGLMTISPKKATSFSIGSHVFLWLDAKNFKGLDKDGYYDLLFSGETGLFARREKRFVAVAGSEETKYVSHNIYLIKIKNDFYEVDSKKSLLDIMKDRQDDLKKYIRANKLDFKKNLESSLVLTTIYYSQLKH
jgi:hypothetical protein